MKNVYKCVRMYNNVCICKCYYIVLLMYILVENKLKSIVLFWSFTYGRFMILVQNIHFSKSKSETNEKRYRLRPFLTTPLIFDGQLSISENLTGLDLI